MGSWADLWKQVERLWVSAGAEACLLHGTGLFAVCRWQYLPGTDSVSPLYLNIFLCSVEEVCVSYSWCCWPWVYTVSPFRKIRAGRRSWWSFDPQLVPVKPYPWEGREGSEPKKESAFFSCILYYVQHPLSAEEQVKMQCLVLSKQGLFSSFFFVQERSTCSESLNCKGPWI